MKRHLSTALVLSLLTLSACSNNSEDQSLREVKQQNAIAKDLKPVASPGELLNYLRNGVLVMANQNSSSLVNTPVDFGVGDGSSEGYSDTNLQVQGVDESNVVQYDGNHLFIAEHPQRYYNWAVVADDAETNPSEADFAKIRVMSTQHDPVSTAQVSLYPLSGAGLDIDGIYQDVDENSNVLSVITRTHNFYYPFDLWFEPWYWTNGRAGIHLLDASNPLALNETFKLEIEGHLIASRKIDNKIYLVTRFTPNVDGLIYNPNSDDEKMANQNLVDSLSLSELLPKIRINGQQETTLLGATDCYLPEDTSVDEGYGTLISVTTIDISDNSINSKCVSGYSDGIFASTTGIYLLASGTEETALHKMGFSEDSVDYLDTGYVKGHLGWRNPAFRLGEHKGVLRVLSSYFTDDASPTIKHQLTLFSAPTGIGQTFQPVGVLPNDSQPAEIGKPGEDIFAVRYVGERGYAVTFEQIDPLYVFDLSDPGAPKIAGELEVTGVSQQLHPIGEDFLIGIGHDVDPTTQWLLGGVKVELFDVRNMSDPKSVGSIILGKAGSISVATFYHHAFSVLSTDSTHHRLSLPLVLHDTLPDGVDPSAENIYYNWTNSGLQLLEIDTSDNPGLSSVGALITATPAEQDFPQFDWYARSVLHNDAVYFSSSDKVWAADWNYPEMIDGPR